MINRRKLLQTGLFAGAAAAASPKPGRTLTTSGCDCAAMPAMLQLASPPGRLKITNMKVFGVTWDKGSDRPYVFVKLETDAGVIGWGEGTLEGKAGAVMATMEDFRPFIIGEDPMRVEHLWQSMYVHTFYRAGPVVGSAISGIDQALWDIRGKVLGQPIHRLLGGPYNSRGVRGYYHLFAGLTNQPSRSTRQLLGANASYREEVAAARERAEKYGVTAFKTGLPGYYEFLATNRRIRDAVERLQLLREVMGDKIDIGIDFHAKTSASVAVRICKEVEDLNLMFVEEPCPPENVDAMKRVSSRTTIPIATGERLITPHGCRQLIEQKVVDIIQVDMAHVGGITALWKIAGMAEASGIMIAPHTCEGPIAGIASLHVDASIPNFMIQEICSGVEPGEKEKIWEEWLGFPAMRMVNGFYPLPDKPGLGIELSESALAKYPFRGTVPFNRPLLEDGSIASP